jgi:lysyl-tRNA synthetase class II
LPATRSRTIPRATRQLEHQAGGEQQKLDEFPSSLEHGIPAALGLGIDRLCMMLLG